MPRMHRVAYLIALLLVTCAGCGDDGQKSENVRPKPAANGGAKPPAESDAEDPGPWFVDEAQQRGITMLNRTGHPGRKEFIMSAVGPGVAVFDANGDGLLDVYVPNGNWLLGAHRDTFYTGDDRPRNALYIQRPDHTFADEAAERGVDHDGWAFGASAADLDNDGDQDLVVANLNVNCLYMNDGTGRFTEIAVAAGVAGRKVDWSTGIAVGDYDKDGLPDLYIANYADLFEWMKIAPEVKRGLQGEIIDAAVCEWQGLRVYCGPLGLPPQQDYLFRNLGGKDGELKFENVTKKSGIWREGEETPLYGFQVIFTDLNRDGWPDIYVANDSVPSFFFVSEQGQRFVEAGMRYNIAVDDMGDDMAGMGAFSVDMNGDGYPDVHKTNFSLQTNNLYISEPFEGRVTFRDYSARTGIKQVVFPDLGWAVLAFDFDHDGDRDIFYANGHVYPEVDSKAAERLETSFEQINQMFRNDSVGETLRFTKVTEKLGPGFAIQKSSRGAALLDFDNDGDLDIVINNLNARPNLLVNKRGSKAGHWLQLRLVGDPAKGTNREGLGATVWIDAGGRRQFCEAIRGQGFLGCSDPRLHVGLGDHDGPVTVEITWPNSENAVQKVTIDKVDRTVEIKQE
jgi:hypothetical protein